MLLRSKGARPNAVSFGRICRRADLLVIETLEHAGVGVPVTSFTLEISVAYLLG